MPPDCAAFGWAEGYPAIFAQGQVYDVKEGSGLHAMLGAENLLPAEDGHDPHAALMC